MEARNSLLQAADVSEDSSSGSSSREHQRHLRDRRRLSCVSEESVSNWGELEGQTKDK